MQYKLGLGLHDAIHVSKHRLLVSFRNGRILPFKSAQIKSS